MKDNKKIIWIIGIIVLVMLMQGGKKTAVFDGYSDLEGCEANQDYVISKYNPQCLGECVLLTQEIYDCLFDAGLEEEIDTYAYLWHDYTCNALFQASPSHKAYWQCMYGICTPDSSCKSNTCIGSTCKDSCGNTYDGTKNCETPKHLVCSNNVCTEVSGSGTNECTTKGATCGSCTATTWTPSTSTVCSGETFKQTKCSEERNAVGTKDCITKDCTSDNDCDSGYKCSSGKCVSEILGDFDWKILLYIGGGLIAFMLIMKMMKR